MIIPEKILSMIKWGTYPEKITTGGQTTGTIITGITLEIEGYFKISINAYRSQLKNKELCLTILELYLMETEEL